MKFILYIIIICFLIPEAKCQNFSKNYYINDDIDAGEKVLFLDKDYIIQFWGRKLDYSQGSVIQVTQYLGLIKTDSEGNLTSSEIYDSLISNPTLIKAGNKLFFGANRSFKNDFERKIYIVESDADGLILQQNELKFNTGNHQARDLGISPLLNLYLTDRNVYFGDSFKNNTWTNDTVQLHVWDTNLNFRKSIVVPYIQPIMINSASTIHDDNYFVTAISYQDTAKSAGGRTRYVAIGFDSLGQQKWIYKNPKNLVAQFQKESIETVAFSDKSTAVLMPYSNTEGSWPRQQIIKLNTKGKKIWSYDDIYDDIYEYYEYISIFKTKDEGIVAVGQNYNQPKDGLPPSGRCGIITRIDKNGSLLWRRKVWDVNVPFNHCGFNSGTELEDGSLLITGWWRDTLPDPYYDTNVWLIKLDSNGCYNPGCVGNDSVTTTQNIIVIGREMIKLSPNPANDYIKVSWNKTPTPAKSLVVYDLSGKAILQSLISDKSGSTELSISELPSGLYVLKIFGDKWESAPEKFVKE